MKFSKKFLLVLSLVAVLATVFTTSAFAASSRVVRPANVTVLKVLDAQPATFRLLGDYTCDSVELKASVSGKVITIVANDVKTMYTGKACGGSKNFRRDVTVGTLVPGTYTIVINPASSGKPQKIIKGFIAPLIPATATPAAPVQ